MLDFISYIHRITITKDIYFLARATIGTSLYVSVVSQSVSQSVRAFPFFKTPIRHLKYEATSKLNTTSKMKMTSEMKTTSKMTIIFFHSSISWKYKER